MEYCTKAMPSRLIINALLFPFVILAAAHLDSVTRLCEKISLIRCLQMPPRSMERMLTNRSFFDNDDSDDPEIFDQEGERLEKAVHNGGMSGNWEKVIL